MENTKGFWLNFTTKEYDFIDTPTDFSNYVPEEGRALYGLYISHKQMQPIDAALKVLRLYTGR